MADDAPVTREDVAALERRLASLERALVARDEPTLVVRCGSCDELVADGKFCARCGAELARPAWRAPPPAPPVSRPAAPLPRPVAQDRPAPRVPEGGAEFALVPSAPARPVPPPAPPRAPPLPPRPAMSLESMLGERWAPRAGAVLVFLGVVFFLGVAIQRGWIGPLLQLAIAVATGAGLLVGGAILTRRRGYGPYPQILEGTGACVLYVTAFVAHALPYYRDETGLTEIGSGLLMAFVAIGTVVLALWRDSRVIAGLGYTLAFVTALLGQDALPEITLPYVALLGTSLAILVSRKAWIGEGAAGTLATGGFFVALSARGQATGDPAPWLVGACAILPAVAFLWLASRPAKDLRAPRSLGEAGEYLPAVLALATLTWAVLATRAAFDDVNVQGGLTLAWALAAAGYAAFVHRVRAHVSVATAAGVAGVALWYIGAPELWSGVSDSALLVTGTYAAAGVALAFVPARGAAWAACVFVGLAALNSVGSEARLVVPRGSGLVVGPWQTWVSALVVLAAAGATIANRSARDASGRRVALVLASLYVAAQAFAVARTPLTITIILVAAASALFALALARLPRRYVDIGADAAMAAVTLLAFAALESATLAGVPRDADLWIEAALLVPALLASFALVSRMALPRDAARVADALVLLPLILWPLAFWREAASGDFLATATYSASALALAFLARVIRAREPMDMWTASFALAGAAAVHAGVLQGPLHAPWASSSALVGGWMAWITLVLVGAALAMLLATPGSGAHSGARAGAIGLAAFFLALWTFALFPSTLLATIWLVVVAAAFLGAASAAANREPELSRVTWIAGMAILVFAALKVGAIVMLVEDVRLSMPLAAAQSILVAGALLVVHHLARRRGVFPTQTEQPAAIMLVGGSAAVLVDFLLAYGEGAWTSLGLGALGVAYLAAGLMIRAQTLYRYAGFAVLGLVLVRVFAVDLSNTDLAVRAVVFAVLGAILLGVGYAYARISKRDAAPPAPPALADEGPPSP